MVKATRFAAHLIKNTHRICYVQIEVVLVSSSNNEFHQTNFILLSRVKLKEVKLNNLSKQGPNLVIKNSTNPL